MGLYEAISSSKQLHEKQKLFSAQTYHVNVVLLPD